MPQCRQEEEKKYCNFTIWPCPSTRTSAPGTKNYKFGRPFLGYRLYTFSLSDLCLGVEKKILNEIMHFHLVIITIYLVCRNLWENIFKEIHKFYPFYPKIISNERGVMKFTCLCLLTLQMLLSKFC